MALYSGVQYAREISSLFQNSIKCFRALATDRQWAAEKILNNISITR